MSKRKICLFTAHSPLTGGGGAILRSLVAQLNDVAVQWCYIGNKPEQGYENGYLGWAVMGGPILTDVWQTWQMLSLGKVAKIDDIVKKLLQVDCDGYWIVSHNEGLRIALELTLHTQRPVHLTVHDDWAGALCARSVRYRLMSGPANKLTVKALNAVTSFDVISAGMQSYYRQLSGESGDVCHRYLPPGSIHFSDTALADQDEILAGHIGSIYDKNDLFAFMEVFIDLCSASNKKAVMQMWGCHLKMADIPVTLQAHIRLYDTLPEEKVIPQLAKCAFVYGMYPLNRALHTFSRTSLPTKLTSYVQACRPILGHGPADSTLAGFLSATGLGAMWSSGDRAEGTAALQQVINLKTTHNNWEAARLQYFGEANLIVMRKALKA